MTVRDEVSRSIIGELDWHGLSCRQYLLAERDRAYELTEKVEGFTNSESTARAIKYIGNLLAHQRGCPSQA